MNLAPLTTFGVEAHANTVVTISSVEQLVDALKQYPQAKILGGGSNILITEVVREPIFLIRINGIQQQKTPSGIRVTVGAGENWHSFVTWCVEHNLGGLENLALIPGTVGAAPMQNIGAYGVEQNQRFVELSAIQRDTQQSVTFTKEQCAFGYRTSVFKTQLLNQFVITHVTYDLSNEPHSLVTTYADVQTELAEITTQPTIDDVYKAVVKIRTNKLPDPNEIGNAGSFFKNPIVSQSLFAKLQADYPNIPSYAQTDGSVKIAAAWLIDQAGWKGYRSGDCGVHHKQALVIVNHGNASGRQLLELSANIQESVFDRFGVELEREVNVW